MEDLKFDGQWTNLHHRSQNGPKLVTNAWIDWFHTVITHVNTDNIVMWVILQNKADLGLFQDSDFVGDVEDSKCAFLEVIRLSQEVGCASNKLQFGTVQQKQKSFRWTQDWGWTVFPHLMYRIWLSQFFTETRIRVMKHGETRTNCQRERKFMDRLMICTMLIVSSNVNSSRQEAFMYVFEDNEAVIKMIIKGRSPTMRHVSRTHRVALDWWFDRIKLDTKIQIKYINTKNQLADILTKGNFTRVEWNHLLCLFNISHFSSTNCSEVMSKRTQKNQVKKESQQIEADDEFSLAMQRKTASESLVKTRYESQLLLSSWTEQQPRTERLVMGATSSNYSEWNVWKQERRGPVRQPAGSFTQHTDRFVIDDDDMDSNSATESDLSLKSRSFLHRVNDRVRKRQYQSS